MKRQFNSSKQILENAPPSKAYRLDQAFPDYVSLLCVIPCGLVVRIRRSHRRGRGSIPRMGVQ